MIKTTLFRTAISIGCLLTLSGIAIADTKIKSRQTSGGQTYENTSYIKGKRQRSETNNGQMVILQQCDLRRNIQIMPEARAYVIQPYDAPAPGNAPNTAATTSQPVGVKKGGVVTSTVTTRDTGERKQMFGYTARHIITTMVTDSTPDACSPQKSKMEIDGWYIDAAFALDCDSSRAYSSYRPQASGGCQDRYETKQAGAARKGFAVWEKTIMFGPNGVESFSTINEVVEFSQATLEPSLFDVPADYREVKDFSSAFNSTYGATESNNTPSQPSNNAASTEVANKPDGVVRVGLVTVKTGSVGDGLNARDLAMTVQNSLVQQLKGANVEVVVVDAMPQPKQFDYVVYATVSHKKGGGGFGSVFGSSAAAVVGMASGSGQNTIKAKDEVTLDVSMQSSGSAPGSLTKQYKAKAKSSGEDIITPLTAQAAQAIADVVKQ